MSVRNDPQEPSSIARSRRVTLDERFVELFVTEDTEERVEIQEIRQLLHRSLQELTPEELHVIELRHQHKKSPGYVAAKLGLTRADAQKLETRALDRIRTYLASCGLER
jgi:RNA polymerase sigma factor (sigma-70 family)